MANIESTSIQQDHKSILDKAKMIPTQVKDAVSEVPGRVAEATHAMQTSLDAQIRTRPLVVGGVAVGVGLTLGALFARTRIGKLMMLAALGIGGLLVVRSGELGSIIADKSA